MKKILVIGELVWDEFKTTGNRVLGGAPANCANRLAESGHEVSLLTGIGDDEDGAKAMEELLSKTNLDLSLVQSVDTPTGTVPVDDTIPSDPSYVITPNVAFDKITLTPMLESKLGEFDVVYFNTLIQRTEPAREVLDRIMELTPSATKVADLNFRNDCYTEETVRFSLEKADVVKISDSELNQIVRMMCMPARTIRQKIFAISNDFDLPMLYVTFGHKGAYAIDRASSMPIYEPGYRLKETQRVDTVGCGDSFFAGALLEFLKDSDLRTQLINGNVLGVLNAMREGALTPIAREEIAAYSIQSHERTWIPGEEVRVSPQP